MAHRRNIGMINGLRPGSPDNPLHDPRGAKYLEDEARLRQDAVNREARRTNPAYGRLNLTEWSERRTASRTLFNPNGLGRPRKRQT